MDPNIYLRTKVPEYIYKTINQLYRLRKATRIAETRNFDSYPTSEDLIKLERKYGDSLTEMDHYCYVKKKKAKKMKNTADLGSW